MSSPAFRIPSPEEQETFAAVVARAFGVTDTLDWVRGLGIENNRVLFEAGELVGGLVRYQAGQWFGGNRLSMVGIAGVAVEPHRRGLGVATRLMREAVASFADEGFDLAALYPATQGVYRRAGFEQAGSRFEIRLPTTQCGFRERELEMRREGLDDRETIEALHRRHGARSPGTVDRSPPLWARIRKPRNQPEQQGYLLEGPEGAEGYCFLAAQETASGRNELHVSDFVVGTERAAKRLLTFFADHASLVDEVLFHGSAFDPLLAFLPEQRHRVTLTDLWMLRILDVRRALERRGYPVALSAKLELEVADEVVPANAGRFTLDLSGGRAEIRPGGSGALRIHVRGLAALYSGFLSAEDLALRGLAEGAPRDLARASAVFAGPAPAMRDFF